MINSHTEQSSEINEGITLVLTVFVTVCYGVYLFQLFQSSLSFASKYRQYFNLTQILESLLFFGKLGVIAFATVESLILVRFLRSGGISFKRFIYLLVVVAASNLLIYAFILYLYSYANTIIQ